MKHSCHIYLLLGTLVATSAGKSYMPSSASLELLNRGKGGKLKGSFSRGENVRPSSRTTGGREESRTFLNSSVSDLNVSGGSEEKFAYRSKGLKKVTGVLLVASLLVYRRSLLEAIKSLRSIIDMEKFKATLLEYMQEASKLGYVGLVMYSFGLCLWNAAGLTTVPVETIAGMVFGVKKGTIFSFLGKWAGALLAFSIGRLFLYEKVKEKAKENDILPLIEESIESNPIGMTFFVRFFPFPEVVKNLALSIMPLKFFSFAIGSAMNQAPFTILWCLVGKPIHCLHNF